ncbi:helix-turn-helix transcriptional regulator [Kitasatospora kifunensis]|uniref:Transcriptional regulator with XRE-family HTH domain n=1 Tax=Kitasatospora kifunensis TaxID=58351 RepID=A0A7W7R971_KITKI|nr:helix-turn-helix transcriptional regulator [Kitasatospora kifunensis]MBB4927745.1 transcriptional regulator with XRE-family HTH domain [Kitasatospora kifunensis]
MASRRDRLAERRIALGYSQERFAEANQVATSTVVRWEAGKATPQPYQRPKLARILKATPEELDALLTPASEVAVALAPPLDLLADGDADDMLRREVLAWIAATGALISLPTGPASASGRHAAPLPDAGPILWQAFRLAEHKRDAMPLVRQQISRLVVTLANSRTEADRGRLCEQVADLYQLAGEISFDGNRYADAAQCYTLAASAAREAGAGTCGPARSPVTPSPSSTIGGRPPRFRCWRRPPGFDGARLAEQRGACHLALGQADVAERYLSVAARQGLSARRQAAVLAGLAELGARHRNVDQVVRYSTAALSLADRTGSGYIVRRLDGLREPLAPLMSDPRVSNLSEQITYRGAS